MINYQLTLEEVAEHVARIRQKEIYDDGKADGISQGISQTAKNLLAMGLSVEQVAQGTGLSLEEITLIHNS